MEIVIGVVALIVAVAGVYIAYLQLRRTPESPTEGAKVISEAAPPNITSDPCLIDIGSVNPPSSLIPNAEVRFSFTNLTGHIIKITSIALKVLAYELCTEIERPKPAVPIDEYYLHARVRPIIEEHELLNVHHEAREKTEGFFLKIEATEGYVYTFSIGVVWNLLGREKTIVSSPEFKIKFPVRSAEGLLRLTELAEASQSVRKQSEQQ